jgi:hypothetical protein
MNVVIIAIAPTIGSKNIGHYYDKVAVETNIIEFL